MSFKSQKNIGFSTAFGHSVMNQDEAYDLLKSADVDYISIKNQRAHPTQSFRHINPVRLLNKNTRAGSVSNMFHQN